MLAINQRPSDTNNERPNLSDPLHWQRLPPALVLRVLYADEGGLGLVDVVAAEVLLEAVQAEGAVGEVGEAAGVDAAELE